MPHTSSSKSVKLIKDLKDAQDLSKKDWRQETGGGKGPPGVEFQTNRKVWEKNTEFHYGQNVEYAGEVAMVKLKR